MRHLGWWTGRCQHGCNGGGAGVTQRANRLPTDGRTAPTRCYSAPSRGAWRAAPDARSAGESLRVQSWNRSAADSSAAWCHRAGARCREAAGCGRADDNRLARKGISRSGTSERLACSLITRVCLSARRSRRCVFPRCGCENSLGGAPASPRMSDGSRCTAPVSASGGGAVAGVSVSTQLAGTRVAL